MAHDSRQQTRDVLQRHHLPARDAYDLPGRVVHESIFNTNDGRYRCPSTQQGYSPFSTWTRGLAWAMLGYAEELEFFATIDDATFQESVGLARADVLKVYEDAARATAAGADDYVPWPIHPLQLAERIREAAL